ncbi:MAG: NAD/NADP octopine/nopaline dehydrogenase family protein [Proteobacteria bacterium]|nr:NAD/NADP octopine/nopaline dehydrogenase family protein [Pseudomonadota bacterium]
MLINKLKNVVIVGGGNLGVSLAVDASQNGGLSVTLLTSKAPEINKSLLKKIDLNGNKTLAKEVVVTADYNEAFSDAHIVLVTLPSFLIKEFVNKVKKYNFSVLIYMPGFGGKEFVSKDLLQRNIVIAGLDRSPYIARLLDANTVRSQIKASFRIGCLDSSRTQGVADLIQRILKTKCVALPNYLTVSFTPSNPILHTARLYSLFKNYNLQTILPDQIKFYATWNDESSKLLLDMDAELQAMCAALKELDLSQVIPLTVHYESEDYLALTKKISSIESFKNIESPLKKVQDGFKIDEKSRYFEEDFNFGLCILKGYAEILGISTPNFDKVLLWYQDLMSKEYLVESEFIGKSLLQTAIPQNYGIKNKVDLLEFYS